MKKQTVTAFTIAFGLVTITLMNTTGYTAPAVTEPDAKAISLVRAALALNNPAKPKTARVHAEGNMLWNNQCINPQQSTRTQPLSSDWKVDFQNRRFLQRSADHLGKDLMWCTEIAVTRRLFLYGEENKGLSYLPSLRASDVRVREIASSAHFLFYDNPVETFQAVGEFVPMPHTNSAVSQRV